MINFISTSSYREFSYFIFVPDYLTTMLYLFIDMAWGRGRGKSSGRSNHVVHVSRSTVPNPTRVSPRKGGTLTSIVTSTQSISPTIFETPPPTPNDNNLIGQGLSTHSNVPIGHTNTIAEGESNSSHLRTLVFLTYAGLVHSFNFITTCCVDAICCLWILIYDSPPNNLF